MRERCVARAARDLAEAATQARASAWRSVGDGGSSSRLVGGGVVVGEAAAPAVAFSLEGGGGPSEGAVEGAGLGSAEVVVVGGERSVEVFEKGGAFGGGG